MRYPLNGPIEVTQPFGASEVDYSQFGLLGHHGCDCCALTPQPVYAPEDAWVYRSQNGVIDQYTGRYAAGETIILNGTYEHWLMHLSDRLVDEGDYVVEGQLIGFTGNTGFTTGPHLHWGVRPLDPDIDNGFRGFIDPLMIMKGEQMAVITTEAVVALSIATTGKQPSNAEERKYIGKEATQENLDGLITYWAAKSRIPELEKALVEANKAKAVNKTSVVDYLEKNLK